MPNAQDLALLLVAALRSRSAERREAIERFQSTVWDMPEDQEEALMWEILGDLATDLAFYQPKAGLRRSSPGTYGDDTVESVIRNGLRRLGDAGMELPQILGRKEQLGEDK